ncbi:MAG TPA: alpha/beta hydrolase [Solirubrobacteraceae bacterium]
MGRRWSLGVVVGLLLGAALATPGTAAAQIAFQPCGHGNEFACAHLSVPLDPSGATPGAISLTLRRHRATVGEARSAIIALAGGPGQAAVPFAEQFGELLGRVAATRDLIVFDQRGTGLSQPLSCRAFDGHLSPVQVSSAVGSCAAQLGPPRAFYTSADTVADIEAIRQAGGYEKLVLYGTSYGTKVAELYAQAHPNRVEGLVLDSVVTPGGPDTLERPTFAALPSVLRSICRRRACRGVTRDPFGDLGRLVARMRRAPLRVRVPGIHGHRRELRLRPAPLLEMLLAGDFSGALRAAFVTDVRAAVQGDTAPIGRLFATAASAESEGEEFDGPLYFATTCEEQSFPFDRAASPAARLAAARAAAGALPASTFAPFSASDAIGLSDIPACARWPYPKTLAPAPSSAPLPAVPTLILSGSEDLRTPTANARELAREIPGSHLLVVPYTGHSVLGEDRSSCSSSALQALFANRPIHQCRAGAEPARLRPPPLPPRSLSPLRPLRGTHGVPGRTARAVELTIADLAQQLLLRIEAGGLEALLFSGGVQTGGLRSGWARLHGSTVSFHDYSFIPGVRLDGAIKPEIVDLHVVGPDAVQGTLRLGPRHALVGRLGGQAVRLPASSGATAAIVASDAGAGSDLDHLVHPGDAGPQRPLPGVGLRGGAVPAMRR